MLYDNLKLFAPGVYTIHTVPVKIIRTPRVLQLNPVVNKSHKIECCGRTRHQIIQNMKLSQGLELELSLWWRTHV